MGSLRCWLECVHGDQSPWVQSPVLTWPSKEHAKNYRALPLTPQILLQDWLKRGNSVHMRLMPTPKKKSVKNFVEGKATETIWEKRWGSEQSSSKVLAGGTEVLPRASRTRGVELKKRTVIAVWHPKQLAVAWSIRGGCTYLHAVCKHDTDRHQLGEDLQQLRVG